MHVRRLTALLGLAVIAAVPEALVRSDNAQIGFQAWLVVQLLGVIVAAIAVAAMFSVLGLGIVRLLTQPVIHRASTFVAWSFLRAPRLVLPLPLRLWRSLTEAVDAQPHVDPAPRTWRLPVVALACLVLGAALLSPTLVAPPARLHEVLARNLGIALFLHGFLLACASLPWRIARVAPPVLALVGAAAALAILGRQPVILERFDPTAAVIALTVVVIVAGLRAGTRTGLATRLVRLGQILMGVTALLGVALALLQGRTPPAVMIAVLSVAVITGIAGIYLALQGQAKVSLPVFVSIVGVAAGTWALIVVLSVMGGFAGDLRAKMLVANAHALVERPGRAKVLQGAAALANGLRKVPGVQAVSPQVRGDAILSSAFNVNNFVAIRGIDAYLPEVERELGHTLVTGSLALLRDPGALGSDRALGTKPALDDSDVPPPLPSAATPSHHQRDLDALLQLAPGPVTPAPPQPAGHAPILLPSATPPQPDEPLAVPGADRLPGTARPPVAEPSEQELPTQDLEPPSPARANQDGAPPDSALQRLIGDNDTPLPGEIADIPLHPGILLGAELARSLQVELGDRLEVVTPDGDVGPTGLRPRVRTFRVAGTFETGLYEADSKVAYVTITEAARYFNVPGDANVIELRLDRPEEPDAVLANVHQALGKMQAPADTEVIDWRALNRSLFSALAFERLVIFLVLGLIILVAAFSIVSALTMVILQKHDSIAMLRAMGETAVGIRAAFLQMGGVIGLIGTTAGAILGIGTCLLILHLGIQLPEAYYVRTLPVRMEMGEIAAVIVSAVALSLVATIFPATSAARLKPLEGLRHG